MSGNNGFKKSFDLTYKRMKNKIPEIKFPCYGGRFYYFLITRHFESLYFYLTPSCLVYTAGGGYVTEIPFAEIKKLSIKRGILFRSSLNIRFVADKKYHLIVNNIKNFSTDLTGDGAVNVMNFIDTLRLSVD